MEFTELADYPVSPGTVTEWHPTVPFDDAAPGADPWYDDPRPTSFVQETRLREADARAGAAHESWLGAAFEIDGGLDADAFGRALTAWIDRHEGLRSHAAPTGPGEVRRRTVTAGRVRVDAARHGYRTSGAGNFEHLHALFDRATSPLSWPAFAFATVEPPDRDRAFTVYFAADHALVDGYSVVLVAQEIETLYRHEQRGAAPDLFPVGSYLDFAARERAGVRDLDAADPVVALWRGLLDLGGGRLPEFPLALGDLPDAPPAQRGLSARVLDAAAADAFAVVCRKIGHGFFPGALACLAVAAAGLTDADRFAAVVPMHTRDAPGWAGSVGWFVGVGPISFGVRGAGSFAELVRRASVQAAAAKRAARVPFEWVGEVLGTDARPRFVVSYMDVRFVPAATSWTDWNARALRSRHYANDVHIWVNRTPEGVNVAARYPATEAATAAVHDYLVRLRTLMAEVAGTGTCRLPDRVTR
ncbi:condensation domain-containing protein [Rhodococcus sp. NPDC058505]|uniref:condensation domain-containing protein n=1 Tax=unclassified Rhodococcus (in: high G+C Gram-positive bacteria) TaxID=192944 RepID=UPI0036594AC4